MTAREAVKLTDADRPWQPIATAPNKGSVEVLTDTGREMIVTWNDSEGWMTSEGWSSEFGQPTHWRAALREEGK